MFTTWLSRFGRFHHAEHAATAVEYAVMLALIIVVVIGGILSVSNQTGGMYGNIDAELKNHGF